MAVVFSILGVIFYLLLGISTLLVIEGTKHGRAPSPGLAVSVAALWPITLMVAAWMEWDDRTKEYRLEK